MTVHVVRRPVDLTALEVPRVGFVVSKAVGNAVERHRTQRRLRHVVAHRLSQVPALVDLVVRAHPTAVRATSAQLDAELDRSLVRALRSLESRSGSGSGV